MSDSYSTSTEAPPVDPTPEDTGGKVSQQEANYRDGNLIYHCGLCQNYEGPVNMSCTKVAGEINPYMLSDEYDGTPNPLKHKTPPQFQPVAAMARNAATSSAAPTPAPDEEATPAPSLRIGRKVY
jgi:hypothetical protein